MARRKKDTSPDEKGQDPRPEVDFGAWCEHEKKRHIGQTLSGAQELFIPLPSIRLYWTQQRIYEILQSFDPPLIVDIKTVQTAYIRVFSILVYVSKVRRLLRSVLESNMDDSHWPLDYDSLPSLRWLKTHDVKQVLNSQWLFCPLFLTRTKLNGPTINEKRILPFISRKELQGAGSAFVTEVEVPSDAHDLIPVARNSEPQKFVIKRYDMKYGQKSYEKEVEALTLLRYNPSSNVIQYFGTFKTTDSGYLVLEYADRGNLESLLGQNSYPKSPEDIRMLWRSLYRTLYGLDRIHQLMEIKAKNQNLEGIHQDIKPSNILLCQGESASFYDFIPKIADFGAPEASYPNRHKLGGLISTKADIFSMGAIFSAAAAWATGGEKAKTAYFERRKKHHRHISTFHKSGYEGCFHNGLDVLEVVVEIHGSICDLCAGNGWDNITPKVIEIIQERMLLSKSMERDHAYQVIERFKQLLDDEPSDDESTMSLIPSHRGSSWASSGTSASKKQGGIESINAFIEQGQSGKATNPVMKDLLDYIEINLSGRAQFFFVDDSTSMREHKDLVVVAFKALLHIARRLDPHKIDSEQEYSYASELMEDKLQRLLESDIIKRLPVRKFGYNLNFISRKHTSLYIFTDGNWGNDPERACGVERPVAALMKELQQRRLGRNQVSLHIVRFGDRENGKRHLDYLDDFGKEQNWDIVDVKHVSSDVRAIVTGPISPYPDFHRQG
ncbi:hypothetical protein GGR57DRAFT_509117 [Xylariaceae sp. FL1272]|nr:hypothetical protein GGR57DRAFT_509117 [Xylariaceae sp. FL1272]